MAAKSLPSQKPVNPPEWVFRWRPLGSPLLPRLIALAVVGTAFGLFITTAQIRVTTPEKSSPRRASLIYLGDDAESRALALRAREGGPFPARFELSSWAGLAEIERRTMESVSYQPPQYEPVLKDLPDKNPVQPLVLAAQGEAFFPQRNSADQTPLDFSQLRLKPMLYPLSAEARQALPEALPAFDGKVDEKLSSPAWRFLICLDAAGGVTECASLESADKAATDALEGWLRRVNFTPAPAKPTRWLALGVGFTNQISDGSDAR